MVLQPNNRGHKKECTEILQRLDKNVATTGEKDPGAVNSAVATILANDRIINVYTSCYLAQFIGSSEEGYHDEFLKLFPFARHTLGTGTPGDIFESDFRLHLEHSHKIRDAQVAVMGDQAEEVMVCLGTSATDGSSKVQWPAGEIKELPDPPADKGACQRTKLNPPTDERTPLWFIPASKTQPFFDFMALFPVADGKWQLKVMQNTISNFKGSLD